MINLKEYKTPTESFIGGWYIPEHICDGVIQYFYECENFVHKGNLGGDNGVTVNSDIKDSVDLSVSPQNQNPYMIAYENYLEDCLSNYRKKYHHFDNQSRFSLNVPYNIQHYKKNGGFKKWHFERTCPDTGKGISQVNRVLVFMTYLNDVEDGGTEFYYQGIKTKAEKGLTLLWPTDFTHTHKGIISHTKEKYIVTGWYTYNEI